MTRFRVSFDHKTSKVAVSDQNGNQREFDTLQDAEIFLDWAENTEEPSDGVNTTF